MKKILKKILPSSLLHYLVNRKNNMQRRRALELEERSPEFVSRKNFYAQFLRPGSTCFDIGANYGNRIGPIIKTGATRIIAVEPQAACCEYLRSCYQGITVLQKGVGAAPGKQTFYISNDSVLSSFSTDFIKKTGNTRFAENTWKDTADIEIITLDSLVATYGIPDFVKVDVEGFEQEVFKGLSKKLKVISFEYTVPELQDNILPIIEKLDSLGHCVFNYSVGESMELALTDWLSYEEMKHFSASAAFIATGFGDIYVKYPEN